MTPRQTLTGILTGLLPRTWRIVPDERTTDVPSKTKVTLKLSTIRPLPAAPNGAHEIEFVVTVTSRLTDMAKAEDDLDDALVTFTYVLDEAGIAWSEARKVMDKDRLAYDITLTLTSTKE